MSGEIARSLIFSEVVEMVTAMGNQLGIAVANARLYQTQLRENEKLTALVDISSGTAQQLELEPLLQRILERGSHAAQGRRRVYLTLRRERRSRRDRGCQREFHAPHWDALSITQGLFGQIRPQRQGRIFTREEVQKHGYSPILRESDICSALVVPLISRNELIAP